MSWTDRDRLMLDQKGISLQEAERQIQLLRNGVPATILKEACTPDNGIRVVIQSDQDRYTSAFHSFLKEKEVIRFVPASGAASRMFKHLFDPNQNDPLFEGFVAGLKNFAFYAEWRKAVEENDQDFDALVESGNWDELLTVLLTDKGLNFGKAPKGVIPFHAYGTEIRNAFVEHLYESLGYAEGKNGIKLHFTTGDAFTEAHKSALLHAAETIEASKEIAISVSFSEQYGSTDTVALSEEGEPVRNRNGALLLRPGGHGALLKNLGDLQADLIFIKNIDNVVPDHRRQSTVQYKQVIGGLLAELIDERNAIVNEGDTARAQAFAKKWFLPNGSSIDFKEVSEVKAFFNRPLRVCGMVKNEGEPGGGPFWIEDYLGNVSAQIVEKAQIDTANTTQSDILESSTHFNPVDIVCHIKDAEGNPFNLKAFLNPERVIIADKSFQGKSMQVIEHPGLWNGAMEGWLTVFVEVPVDTFAPVKTVNDLLRESHQ